MADSARAGARSPCLKLASSMLRFDKVRLWKGCAAAVGWHGLMAIQPDGTALWYDAM